MYIYLCSHCSKQHTEHFCHLRITPLSSFTISSLPSHPRPPRGGFLPLWIPVLERRINRVTQYILLCLCASQFP